MPPRRANTSHNPVPKEICCIRLRIITYHSITTAIAIFTKQSCAIHSSTPNIQTTILSTIFRIVILTPTRRIQFRRRLQVGIVQILNHPGPINTFNIHRLINLSVTFICHFAINNFYTR